MRIDGAGLDIREHGWDVFRSVSFGRVLPTQGPAADLVRLEFNRVFPVRDVAGPVPGVALPPATLDSPRIVPAARSVPVPASVTDAGTGAGPAPVSRRAPAASAVESWRRRDVFAALLSNPVFMAANSDLEVATATVPFSGAVVNCTLSYLTTPGNGVAVAIRSDSGLTMFAGSDWFDGGGILRSTTPDFFQVPDFSQVGDVHFPVGMPVVAGELLHFIFRTHASTGTGGSRVQCVLVFEAVPNLNLSSAVENSLAATRRSRAVVAASSSPIGLTGAELSLPHEQRVLLQRERAASVGRPAAVDSGRRQFVPFPFSTPGSALGNIIPAPGPGETVTSFMGVHTLRDAFGRTRQVEATPIFNLDDIPPGTVPPGRQLVGFQDPSVLAVIRGGKIVSI